MKRIFGILLSLALLGVGCAPSPAPEASAPAVESPFALTEIDVHDGDLRGLFVAPIHGSDLPGIVMVHEWWGLNEYIKSEARRLSKEGYAVFAIDLYDGNVATDAKTAGELAGAVRKDPAAAVKKMEAALDYLTQRPEVADNRLAGLGWCFGGGQIATLATEDSRIKASVIYYGTPVTDPAKLAKIQHPVLGVWGKEDQAIPLKDAQAFEAALKQQETPVEFHYYDGAGHAFANPSGGDSYKKEAAEDAWGNTLRFLNRTLK